MKIEQKRQAREVCLQLMFQEDLTMGYAKTETALDHFQKTLELKQDTMSKARQYIQGILQNEKEIDEMIQNASLHWKKSRMSLIDLNIIRLAIYEIFFQEHPVSAAVAINEALEISKKYSSQDSSQFINGVLDKVAKVGRGSDGD